MKRAGRDQHEVFSLPRDLQFESVKPLLDLSACAPQITGDMQIALSELELLKQESTPLDPESTSIFYLHQSLVM
ncbi:MAG: hypothetical protein ABJA90_02730 [Ginsengibacter sp.]